MSFLTYTCRKAWHLQAVEECNVILHDLIICSRLGSRLACHHNMSKDCFYCLSVHVMQVRKYSIHKSLDVDALLIICATME